MHYERPAANLHDGKIRARTKHKNWITAGWYDNCPDHKNRFMKKILIFTTIASIAIVVAYYLVIDTDRGLEK